VKRLASIFWIFVPSVCFAGDGLLGTKLGGEGGFVPTQSSPVGAGPVSGQAVVQLVIALGVVLLLVRYVLPKALNKVNRRLNTSVSGGIHVEESASFAGGNLYVVTARNKTLLLSVTGTAVTFLSDLTETQPTQIEAKTFQEMLEDSSGEEPEVPEAARDLPDAFAETLARLDRLDRLASS
jgi:flagellar biogenesis protein FliO